VAFETKIPSKTIRGWGEDNWTQNTRGKNSKLLIQAYDPGWAQLMTIASPPTSPGSPDSPAPIEWVYCYSLPIKLSIQNKDFMPVKVGMCNDPKRFVPAIASWNVQLPKDIAEFWTKFNRNRGEAVKFPDMLFLLEYTHSGIAWESHLRYQLLSLGNGLKLSPKTIRALLPQKNFSLDDEQFDSGAVGSDSLGMGEFIGLPPAFVSQLQKAWLEAKFEIKKVEVFCEGKRICFDTILCIQTNQ